MITLQSLSLASLLVLGSGAAPDAVSPAVSATQATAATAIEVPGPGLQLDLYQTHGVITMPETPCGYQMLVMGTPGAHFEVQVLRTGDRPFVVGGGQLGEDGTPYDPDTKLSVVPSDSPPRPRTPK